MLRGRTAVITGCLRGIGRATLELFAEKGADIWACAENSDPEFEEAITALSERHHVTIRPLYFNLLDHDAIKTAMQVIVRSKTGVDILVNVAGMTHNALFNMTTIDKMRELFEVNFISQMLITQYISKLMSKQHSGSIINIASVTGMDGNRGQLAYSASKAALIGATKTLAIELADSGIRVNAIAPGVIETNMTMSLPSEELQKLLQRTTMKRTGLPIEVANVLVFLASDMSSYMTGQVIRVDGGM
jgi:3-oxoacyl-[acyl-carrier protein] reductase